MSTNLKICIDKLLPTRAKRISAARSSIIENPDNAPTSNLKHPLSLALETEKRWAIGRTLSVYFMEGSATQKKKVEAEAHKIEEFANIKLIFTNNPKSELRVKFDNNEGSWSYIGTDSLAVPFKEPTINLGWLENNTDEVEYQRVCIHEFIHGAIGSPHEHNSPSANIAWNKPVVYKYFKGPPNYWTKEDVDFNLFEKYSVEQTQYSTFDPLSIMCYAIPAEFTLDGFSTPWNTSLSAVDKKYLGLFYPFTDIKLDGSPRLLTFPADIVKQLDVVLTDDEIGRYEITIEPAVGTWLSVINPDKSKKFSKDHLLIDLSAGKSILKVRNKNIGGKYKVYVRPVAN